MEVVDPDTLAALVTVSDCKYGRMMYLTHDGYIGRSLDTYGEFSEGEVFLWRQLLQPGDVALDVGANIGAHTVALARLVGATGAVLAFEPIRYLYAMLSGNLALNGLVNVRAYHYAVGAQGGALRVPAIDFTRPGNYGGMALGGYDHGEIVPVVRLDDLQLARCRFVKVDVEGMEREVIQGATELIARCRPILYVENNGGEKGPPLVETIRALGYDLYWHYPPLDPDGETVSHNMLCLPSGSPPPNDMEAVT